MPFRVKDLMIDVTSAAGLANQNIQPNCFQYTYVGCHFYHTYLPCVWGCTHPQSYFPCAHTLPVTFTCPGSLITDTLGTQTIVENPGFLKERLKVALAAAEAAYEAQGESFQIQTAAEADQLETKLSEALTEVRARKAQLSQPAPQQQQGKK